MNNAIGNSKTLSGLAAATLAPGNLADNTLLLEKQGMRKHRAQNPLERRSCVPSPTYVRRGFTRARRRRTLKNFRICICPAASAAASATSTRSALTGLCSALLSWQGLPARSLCAMAVPAAPFLKAWHFALHKHDMSFVFIHECNILDGKRLRIQPQKHAFRINYPPLPLPLLNF